MLGFGAKKKRSVENWRRRARWIDLKKTQVIIISPETQSAVDNSKVSIPVDYPQNITSVIDFPTLHQMETSFSGTSVSFEEIYPMSPGIMKGRSFEKEIDVRSLGRNATNKWIIRTLKNLPSKTE
jgi:hypothetical protein